MPLPSHQRNNAEYREILRRYTQARQHWRTVAPLIALGVHPQISEREYCDAFVDVAFPPLTRNGEFYSPGRLQRDFAFDEADIEVFR